MLFNINTIGIQVIPWISGEVDDVISAFKNNTLESCVMPGCLKTHRRGRRCRRGRKWDKYAPGELK
jgi:hypothetical protein